MLNLYIDHSENFHTTNFVNIFFNLIFNPLLREKTNRRLIPIPCNELDFIWHVKFYN